ncbi:hypothetical protein [Xylocopilactobacillus apis]|uniref:hypothetical protein n=1 Tax=Xylocopilactobacillus apis TaxID=2932183 RepID=UPI002954C88D|nr:hypothetical protein [Xylocopilactobacillus apis]
MKINKELPAFTLIETIITISITVMVINLSLLIPKKILQNQELTNFSNEINKKFNVLKERALVNNEQLFVEFDHERGKMTVKELNSQETKTCVKVPTFLFIVRTVQIRLYGEAGISPTTISFRDKNTNALYRLTLQMGWGNASFVKV